MLLQGLGESPKIKIKGTKNEISLDDFHFQNFRYVEDINLGFPTIEFDLRDNAYDLLRKNLFGDEELIIEEFDNDRFKMTQKSFRIKSVGSLGAEPKPVAAQTLKIIAIDKTYDSILKNQKSHYFKTGEVKKISDLLKNFLETLGIEETKDFKINIENTAPLKDQGFSNLYIPYSRDPMKVIRKLCNYAMTPDGTGAFVFFINRKGLNFVPVSKLFVDVTDKTPHLQITDLSDSYDVAKFRLSPFNAFTNFITGHEKKVMGFNLLEKEYDSIWYKPNARYIEHSEYIDKPETVSNVKTMSVSVGGQAISIPFSKDFVTGNVKTYYTPLDNPLGLKAFADRLYYSQMFNFTLELEVKMLTEMMDFAIGEMVSVEFPISDMETWSELNGGWLLKSMSYIYPGDSLLLKLTRIGIGTLPEDYYVKVGE
jgi:hypothetical protein